MSESSFLHQLLHLPTVLEARLSPDGQWVAFTWYHRHETIDVFAARTDGSAAPLVMTHTSEQTDLVSWTPDSSAVIVAEDHGGDERARLFRVRLDRPGHMEPLTEDRPPYFIRGGDLHPDGRTLFYGANHDLVNDTPLLPTWMYRHDLQTGERVPIARPERPAYSVPRLNRPGTHLIYARKDRHPAGFQIHLVDVSGVDSHDVEGGRDREILNFGDAVKASAQWLPDGRRLLVITESRDGRPQAHRSLGIYHPASGEMQWLIDDPARNIEDASVSPDGLIVVDEIDHARHRPSFLDPATGAEHRFPERPGNVVPIGRAGDRAWIAFAFSAAQPTDLVRIEPDGNLTSLTRVWEHTALDASRLTAAEDWRWQSVDGVEIQGWLYRARPNRRRAIVYVHGGPSWHSEDRLDAQVQYLVSQGLNVLDVNYRGSTGFGLEFREMIKEDGWGGREQADITAGAQALIHAGLAAPGSVGVTGTSYGGYSAWCQITHQPPEVIAAAAPICGMTDLVVDYDTTRPDLRPFSEEMMGGRPDQVPERYFERSPINFVQQIRGRVLIVQGAQDPNVTPENVRQVIERLDAHRIPYERLEFQDEGHGIARPANQEVLFSELAAFFDRAL